MTTSIDGARKALASVLAAVHAADADPVQVAVGPAVELTDRVVQVLGARGSSEADAMDLGTQAERYVIEVRTSVNLAMTPDQALATAAVLDMWTREEAAVREHATGDLGASASGVLAARVSGEFEFTEPPTAAGREAVVRWGVLIIGQRQ